MINKTNEESNHAPFANTSADARQLEQEASALRAIHRDLNGLRQDLSEHLAAHPQPSQEPSEERLLTAREVAARWGVSVRTIETEVAEGNLVATYVRGARRFTLGAIRAYETDNTTGAPRRRAAGRSSNKMSQLRQDRSTISRQTTNSGDAEDLNHQTREF